MNPKLNKTKRTAVLDQQDSECALCEQHLAGTKNARHDKKLNWMLCPACMLLISNVRTSQERGVTFKMIVDYESRESQEDPVVKSDRRKCVEDGRVSYREPNGTYRRYESWDEACRLHSDWAAAEERLNS